MHLHSGSVCCRANCDNLPAELDSVTVGSQARKAVVRLANAIARYPSVFTPLFSAHITSAQQSDGHGRSTCIATSKQRVHGGALESQ